MGQYPVRWSYWALIAATLLAAGVLANYAFVAAWRFERLGEQSLAGSTLSIVREKVNRIEDVIINADNAVFHLIDPNAPANIGATWLPLADQISPSVRTVIVMDQQGTTVGAAARFQEDESIELARVYSQVIAPSLVLPQSSDDTPSVVLRHFHQPGFGRLRLISFKTHRLENQILTYIAEHDLDYIKRELLTSAIDTSIGETQANIIDDESRLVVGKRISDVGGYVVSLRFPTTLYGWRLQVAPRQAGELEATGRSQRFNTTALIVVCGLVLLLGTGFTAFASFKEQTINAKKMEFVANVSHELKTPISVIRMFSEMIATQHGVPPDKHKEYMRIIFKESERVGALIDNVLDFSALQYGKRTFGTERTDLIAVINRAIDAVSERYSETQQVQIELNVQDTLPHLNMDEQAVLLATINLLDNAIKYGQKTPILVRLYRESKHVVVSVSDRGPGIPHADLKRVFERFYRGNHANQVRGSGIGLSLVRYIAEAHGGSAWAENTKPGGANICFSIPISTARFGFPWLSKKK